MSAALDSLANRFPGAVIGEERPHPALTPVPLVAPESIEGFVEVLRRAATDGLVVQPVGLGSRSNWTAPATRVDLLLSTRHFTGIVSHVPDDGTLTARAGTRMSELRERAASGGHWLTPDVGSPQRRTLGGTIAAGHSGLDRQRLGPARNHVLGLKVVLGDGSVTHSGGRLVKNVTGFDLPKLYSGSHGTLCVILEAALRLFPLPEERCVVLARTASRERALALAREASRLAVRAWSLVAFPCEPDPAGAWTLAAELGGKREAVEHERALLQGAWPDATCVGPEHSASLSEHLRELGGAPGSWVATCLPGRLAAVLAMLDDALGDCVVRPFIEPGAARVSVELALEPAELARRSRTLRTVLSGLGARLAIRTDAALSSSELERFAEPGPELALMRRLRAQLDPEGRFAAGRFHGGL